MWKAFSADCLAPQTGGKEVKVQLEKFRNGPARPSLRKARDFVDALGCV